MIQNMEIKVSNVQFVTVKNVGAATGEEQRVHVRFQGIDSEKEININGYVPATVEEYETNSSMDGLSTLVKKRLIERLEA
ncbi:hypothetical protein [Virgibacillus litoralis]|uniref:Uncharacterized protein n=1 Tax=Virgibacillus litoralis TaxID=578221 RepID=A0ABS4HHA4_9BACI|nr:hypothetical protein [Virgibacillus litoralis]MBP1950305.1 hypothetical protein [Virgibacillus litoralis]